MYIYLYVCVCVWVTNIFLTLTVPKLFPYYTIAIHFPPILLPPQLYTASSATLYLRQLLLDLPTHLPVSHVCRIDIYPLYGASSAISAPSKIFGRYQMRA